MVRQNLTVSDRVIRAVARETNTDPLELPPLYNVVDGESLDAHVKEMDGKVSFSYAGVTVTVYSTGTVEVSPTTTVPPASSTEDAMAAGD